jgi:hypothetical protein
MRNPNWRLGLLKLALSEVRLVRSIDRRDQSDEMFTPNLPKRTKYSSWIPTGIAPIRM